MYHQQQHQLHTHTQHLSSRPSLSPEKKFLRQGQGGGDSGLILSTDAKPRLKWTSELHERFVEAVNQLGGPDKATPKTIMRVMGIPGLTLYHLKSHLQKFRLGKNLQTQAAVVNVKNVLGFVTATDKACEGHGSPADHLNRETGTSKSMHISETLQMQIEVQRRLHEQIEVQRHLQLRIEAQGKYLHSVLEKAQEALAKNQHAAGAGAGHEAGKPPARQRLQRNDGSADGSCLTAASDEGILSIGLSSAAAAGARRAAVPPLETPARSSSGRDRGPEEEGEEEEEECFLFLGKPEHHEERIKLGLSIGGGERIDLNGSSWKD